MRYRIGDTLPDPSWKSGPPDPQPCEDGEHCRCCLSDGTCCWCGTDRVIEGPESAYDNWAEYELDRELDRQ